VTSYLVVFAVAAAATAVLTPLVRRLALRVGAVVPPGDRSVHTVPTATLGGVAIFAGFALAMGVAWLVPGFEPAFSTSEPLGVLLGAAVIFAVGLLDDLRDWSAPAKVAGMVLAASLVQVLGVTMFYFRIPFADLVVLSPDMAFVMGVVWILVMVNAVNLVDGLDGLAAGICAIAVSYTHLTLPTKA
jgi:UDP-GlcNAc:undecaprenyl-phosphate GlcNAc-1-phosphate transferase